MEKSTVNLLWVIVSTCLVFLMQAGFLCLETGFTRSKNNINVAMKNMADFAISAALFWLVGFALMPRYHKTQRSAGRDSTNRSWDQVG